MHSCSLGMYSRGPTTLSATSGLSSRTVTGVRISSSGAIWLTSLHLKIQFGSESNIDPIALPPPICFWKASLVDLHPARGRSHCARSISIAVTEPFAPSAAHHHHHRAPEGTTPTISRLLSYRFLLADINIAKEAFSWKCGS